MSYAKKAAKNSFQICFFIFSVAWGWYELRYKPYMPWFLGGLNPDASFKYGVATGPYAPD
jgi:hypothetical protein